MYLPSLSIGPPEPPLARREWLDEQAGWYWGWFHHLSKCTDLSLPSTPLFPVRNPWAFQVRIFWSDCQRGMAWRDNLQDIWARRQERSILDRISLPHCSEDAGFVWSLLAVLSKGRGLVTALVCCSSWPQFWWFNWYVQLSVRKILSGLSLELKTVDCGWTFTLCQWNASSPPQGISFCLSSTGAFLPLKDTNIKSFRTWEIELCEPTLLLAVNRKICRHQVHLIILPQFSWILNCKRASELSVCTYSKQLQPGLSLICVHPQWCLQKQSSFFSFHKDSMILQNFHHFHLWEFAIGRRFPNSSYPLSKDLLLFLPMYRAMITFGPCTGTEFKSQYSWYFLCKPYGKKITFI